jgi:hypothetical protein
VIKASALLVALAIGLLVAGVVGSSLLMVYVSIGVCAVAALLLAAGVLSHWSEIFGRREARPASTQGAWSEPQVNVTAPVLASLQAVAAERAHRHSGREEAGVRPVGARSAGARSAGAPSAGAQPVGAHPVGAQPAGVQSAGVKADGARAGGGRVPDRPAEVVPAAAEVTERGDEFSAPRRSDDLWERVEEELGSAAKRDTGALSWPATVFPPIQPDMPLPAESRGPAPEAGSQGEPRAGASASIWGSGAGWQPPETHDPAWPPPAAAFAEPKAAPERADPEPPVPESADPESAVPEAVVAEPANRESGRAGDTAGTPVPDETAAPASRADVIGDTEVAGDAEAAPVAEAALADEAPQDADVAEDAPDDDAAPADGVDSGAEDDEPADLEPADLEAADHEAAEPAPESAPGKPAAGGDGPQWIIAASRPAGQRAEAGTPAAPSPAAREAAAEEPAAEEPAREQPGVEEPAVEEPGAGVPESAAEAPAGDGAAAKPAPPGQVEVTVVPGVARYHRSECILIRFLGAGDLETMTRQEAEDASMMACRACQPDLLEA